MIAGGPDPAALGGLPATSQAPDQPARGVALRLVLVVVAAAVVADLEAIRRRIGAQRMVLLGHSYGAQVATAYLAAHPDHVAKVVFSSPGARAPALDDGSSVGVRRRLSTSQQLGLYRLLLRPRMLLAYSLLQVNPLAAHAFAGDAEMDARNDRVYNAGRAGTARAGLLRRLRGPRSACQVAPPFNRRPADVRISDKAPGRGPV